MGTKPRDQAGQNKLTKAASSSQNWWSPEGQQGYQTQKETKRKQKRKQTQQGYQTQKRKQTQQGYQTQKDTKEKNQDQKEKQGHRTLTRKTKPTPHSPDQDWGWNLQANLVAQKALEEEKSWLLPQLSRE